MCPERESFYRSDSVKALKKYSVISSEIKINTTNTLNINQLKEQLS